MLITAEKPNGDDPTTSSTRNYIYCGTEDEVLASILGSKNEPMKFIESVMNIIRKKSSDVFMSPTFSDGVARIIKAERDAAEAEEDEKKVAMSKEKIEALAETVLLRKGGPLDFIDFAMKVVRKKTDLFKTETCVDSVMRIVNENRRVAEAEMDRAKAVLANILESVVQKLIQNTYDSFEDDLYGVCSPLVMRKDMEGLEEIDRRVVKMVYRNSEEFRRDVQIRNSEFINSVCRRLLDEKTDEIEYAEAGIKKACSL